jgi:hypothetical protein
MQEKKRQEKKGTITVQASVPQIQAAFKYLPGGGARISLDLTPESTQKYLAFIQIADREMMLVNGELSLEDM